MISNRYRIKRRDKGELKPEETFADSLSELSIMEAPISRKVFDVVYLLITAGFIFVIFQSFQLQVIKGSSYVMAIQENYLSKYSAPSLRGIIYDSISRPLVENIPIFDLIAVHSDLPVTQAEMDNISEKLAPITGQSISELIKTFEDNSKSAFFFIKKNLSKEETVKINSLSFDGIYIVANSERHYPAGNAFTALLGYTSKVNQEDINNDQYYLPTDKIGKLGLEQYYENELRGEHRDIFLNNNLQDSEKKSRNLWLDFRPGNNLYLNINREMQEKLFSLMDGVLKSAGLSRGAAIVQDVNTGAVLSLVSLPTFDSNIFENYYRDSNSEKINNLLHDKNKPLFNRVISGRYSPGSTIKPLLALAGLKEGIVTPETTIMANGSISVRSIYDPNVVWTFNDWKVHGLTDIRKAIADSVDVFFYALGGGYGNIRGLGEEKIISYLKQMSTDKKLGIDLAGEITGFVPDEAWKIKTKGEKWYIGDTFNISIGQGDLGVTPLWLNSYIGAIANGGNIMKPFIVKEIKNSNGDSDKIINPEILVKIPFDNTTIKIVREGMRQTVTSGTAKLLQDLPKPVAAKTGTAQVSLSGLNSLFVTYGPYENPEVVITILIENVESQGLAINVAHDFYSWYFGEEN